MKRGTKLFLLFGCALVFVLEAPSTLALLADGWRGPYVDARVAARHAAQRTRVAGLNGASLAVLANLPRH